MGRKSYGELTPQQQVHSKDIEANRFAMELLMPAPWVKQDYEELVKKGVDPMVVPEKLALKYQVTPGMMGARIRDLKLGFFGVF